MRAVSSALLILWCTGAAASPPGSSSSARVDRHRSSNEERIVERIRALYTEINASTPRKPSAVLWMSEDGVWSAVTGRTAPIEFAPIADVYRVSGVVRKVVVSVDPPGGDWSSVAEHYFYPDGRLAFRFERLRSFQGHDPAQGRDGPSGPFVVETRTYFDETGKRVRQLEKAFFEPTGKQIAASYVSRAEVTTPWLTSTTALIGTSKSGEIR